MKNVYKILLVENSDDNELFVRLHLGKEFESCLIKRVENLHDFIDALHLSDWDLVITNYILPAFSAHAVLCYLCQSNRDIPVIVFSEQAGEESAVQVMRWGQKILYLKKMSGD